jgi:hypothetical protein
MIGVCASRSSDLTQGSILCACYVHDDLDSEQYTCVMLTVC